ncbi:MAG: hypothetical protein Q9169_000866 [Polycauliona sp. 2 TL-2023]
MTEQYPHGHHQSVLRGHRWPTVANSAAYLSGSLQPDMVILDVGCGPGSITVDLASMAPQGKVIGLDTTEDPFEEGLKLAAERGVNNVSFKVGDARQLPFPDQTFDMVHAHQVLQYLNQVDRVQAIREMRRVAKIGGLVCMREADQGTVTFYPEVDGLKDFIALYCHVARANGGEPEAGRRLHAWVKEVGFLADDIVATAGTWCYNSLKERSWWSSVWADRILHSSWRDTTINGGHASQKDLDRLAEAWRAWGSSDDGWYAIVHGEVLCRYSSKPYPYFIEISSRMQDQRNPSLGYAREATEPNVTSLKGEGGTRLVRKDQQGAKKSYSNEWNVCYHGIKDPPFADADWVTVANDVCGKYSSDANKTKEQS